MAQEKLAVGPVHKTAWTAKNRTNVFNVTKDFNYRRTKLFALSVPFLAKPASTQKLIKALVNNAKPAWPHLENSPILMVFVSDVTF